MRKRVWERLALVQDAAWVELHTENNLMNLEDFLEDANLFYQSFLVFQQLLLE